MHISLTRAHWQTEPGKGTSALEPRDMSAHDLFFNWCGKPQLQADYHGRLLRIQGIVASEPMAPPFEGTIRLSCEGGELPLDVSAHPNIASRLPLGSTVCVTGVFFVEAETWRPNAPFPRVTGYRLIVRTPEDVEVVSLPSRWTTARLLAVIGVLILALTVIIVWNRALRHLVNRRSRELLKSEIAKTENALRVDERTRLAVELHDSIAQNLTGVTLQLNASQSVRAEDPVAADDCLDNAMRMLQSCRTDLRRCIWDLRNDALDEPDFSLAIKKTLQPVASGADIHIRFLIARSRISDATAHAVLRILRELTSNAVLHGAAHNIRIAGEMSTGILKFSVRDDGRGFDTALVQGPTTGHFGLTGIRERIKASGGQLTIVSQPGHGTYVSVEITHPKDKTEKK